MLANSSSRVFAASSIFWRLAGGLSSPSSPLAADAVAWLLYFFAEAVSANLSFFIPVLVRRLGWGSRGFPSLTRFVFSRLMNASVIVVSEFWLLVVASSNVDIRMKCAV